MKLTFTTVLVALMLAGCDNTTDMATSLEAIKNNCRGTLTVSMQMSSTRLNDSLTVTCTEDASEEARAKHKEVK